ncbi:MAG: methyltransferase domain-containing protein [Patescibacteria group bacterium]|jgi:2-polyprenyl-3-methyl-5-hydroxy-6-metoxy-1,4-benzoquinol methylase
MKDIQAKHFNSDKNQYISDKLFNPPLHVQDELDRIISFIKKNSKKRKVVDFGSGNGRLTIPLLKNGFFVTSVDISNKSLLNLYHNAQKVKRQKKLKTVLTLPKNTDIICGTDILHHVNLKNYFPLFYQSLNRNGFIIFSEPNILNIGWSFFISLFLDWKIEKGIIQINYFNLIKQLKLARFKNVKIIGLFLFPPMIFNRLSIIRKLNLYLGNLPILRLFAFRYIITASK